MFKLHDPFHWVALFGPFLESLYDKFEAFLVDGIVKKHLPNSPSYIKLQLQVGGFMMNSISDFVYPRKFPRNFEFVGGMHIEKENSKAIPQVCKACTYISVSVQHIRNVPDLQEIISFITKPHDGLFIFSLGTMVRPELIPRDTLIAIKGALSRFPTFLIIALLEPSLGKKLRMPKNVLCTKPIPQAALLNHPSTKLFINHFGGNGVFEAIWSGVPMVGMLSGAGGDNHYISDLVLHHGIGIRIDPIPSEDEVWQAINMVLNNDRYNIYWQSHVFV